MKHSQSQSGVTLIELMIALVLGLLISAALGSIFVMSTRGYSQDQRLLELQDASRVALDQMVNDIEMAGHWGTIFIKNNIVLDASLPSGGTNCEKFFFNDGGSGPPLDVNVAYSGTTDDQDNVFGCMGSASSDHVMENSEVIGVNRALGSPLSGAGLIDTDDLGNGLYLWDQPGAGELFRVNGATKPSPALSCTNTGEHCWTFSPAIYFISKHSSASGADGVPTLCRKLWVGSGAQTQYLIPGVERMVLEYGIDNNGDGYADKFERYDSVPANAAAQTARETELKNLTAVRIYLLVRSEEQVPGYTNEKSYQLGPVSVSAANDRYYRKVVSATAVTRNILVHQIF